MFGFVSNLGASLLPRSLQSDKLPADQDEVQAATHKLTLQGLDDVPASDRSSAAKLPLPASITGAAMELSSGLLLPDKSKEKQARAKLRVLKQAYKTLEYVAETLMKQKQQTDTQIEVLQSMCTQFREENTYLKASLQETKATLTQTEQELQESRTEATRALQQYAQLEAEAEEMKHVLSETSSQYALLKRTCNSLSRQLTSMSQSQSTIQSPANQQPSANGLSLSPSTAYTHSRRASYSGPQPLSLRALAPTLFSHLDPVPSPASSSSVSVSMSSHAHDMRRDRKVSVGEGSLSVPHSLRDARCAKCVRASGHAEKHREDRDREGRRDRNRPAALSLPADDCDASSSIAATTLNIASSSCSTSSAHSSLSLSSPSSSAAASPRSTCSSSSHRSRSFSPYAKSISTQTDSDTNRAEMQKAEDSAKLVDLQTRIATINQDRSMLAAEIESLTSQLTDTRAQLSTHTQMCESEHMSTISRLQGQLDDALFLQKRVEELQPARSVTFPADFLIRSFTHKFVTVSQSFLPFGGGQKYLSASLTTREGAEIFRAEPRGTSAQDRNKFALIVVSSGLYVLAMPDGRVILGPKPQPLENNNISGVMPRVGSMARVTQAAGEVSAKDSQSPSSTSVCGEESGKKEEQRADEEEVDEKDRTKEGSSEKGEKDGESSTDGVKSETQGESKPDSKSDQKPVQQQPSEVWTLCYGPYVQGNRLVFCSAFGSFLSVRRDDEWLCCQSLKRLSTTEQFFVMTATHLPQTLYKEASSS